MMIHKTVLYSIRTRGGCLSTRTPEATSISIHTTICYAQSSVIVMFCYRYYLSRLLSLSLAFHSHSTPQYFTIHMESLGESIVVYQTP